MSVDVLLANPLFLARDPVERRLMTPYFPLGLLYLAACLREAGFSVAIFDGMFKPGPESFTEALRAHRPRVVGLSILTTVRATAVELAQSARAAGAVIVVGGSDPTARPESYLEPSLGRGPVADFVVIGEGEDALVALVATILGSGGPSSWAQIPGIAYRLDDELVLTQPRSLRRDIDSIPIPARELTEVERYREAWREKHGFFSLSVITSRGCPYGCAWCQKSVFGRSYRPRSPQLVAQEMREIKTGYAPDRLRIVDDVLGIDKDWVRRWRNAVVERDAVIPFECLSRVDLVDRELLEMFKQAGCMRIAFGAESGSQRVLDAMNKGTQVAQIRQAARWCHDLGIELYFFIMVGYPGEEWRDILATVSLLRETVPDAFSSTIAYPLPGTPFYEEVCDRLVESPDWDYTAENRLMYRGRYSTRFYRWVQRWLHAEWQFARMRRRGAPGGKAGLLGQIGKLVVARCMVGLLRLLPADVQSAPKLSPGH
ncbi:MAG: B12-binding domain-containing radical SAM protein [Anaerolineae bacterium]|nr:B12-binding domain-containing radical SAM protein [Anaerolineae bacterium]